MNIQEMMRQAQTMQKRMQEMQEKLGKMEVSGVSGGGLVKFTMTCKGEVTSCSISDEALLDRETLEDMIMAALNMARKNADDTMADETRKMMEEMGIPANIELPGA